MVFCFQNDSKYIVTKKKYIYLDFEGVEFAKKCMFFRFDTLEQLYFKLEKNNWDLETYGKVRKNLF